MTEEQQSTQDQITFLENRIADSNRKIDSLLRQNGVGVRASWVSTDIAIEQDRINRLKREIEELKA